MFVDGAKEWIGENARTFLLAKTLVEQKLLTLGYDYFYGGIVSKRSVYDAHTQLLGDHFKDIFIDFSYHDTKYILAPEYTFRVYEYLHRNGFPADYRKVFYSQEMMRNETDEDLQCGKTFSFCQIGFEIFGEDDRALSMESIGTLWECLHTLPLDGLYFRISDKRILQSLCRRYAITEMNGLLHLLETCAEDGSEFYRRYVERGGDKNFAESMKELLDLGNANAMTLEALRSMLKNDLEPEVMDDLEAICTTVQRISGQDLISIVPAMPKTWDAYTTFVYDARVFGYDKAIAGGGNLFIDTSNPNCVHSGAGIGITRIAEHLITMNQNVRMQNALSLSI